MTHARKSTSFSVAGHRVRTALLTLLTTTAVVAAGAFSAAPASGAPGTMSASPAGLTVARAAAVAQAAAPVGKLVGTGCSFTQAPAAASCDLYAMTGSLQILGAPQPIWGFSSTSAAGSASAPGPKLVVHQGEVVTITVHNQLPSQQLSLALPGQQSPTADGLSGDDSSGVATGGSRTYSFTATRPGTFVYEAGHTPNGARQVAMGLAGALVVLPADGTAYGSTATAYDDESVLVMSELDPALNADPMNFDMRNFAPKFRMFNGKPYPGADPISTDQGHTLLLRYVNVGSQTHAMSVLGRNQVEIAQDGHPSTYSTTVAAESVEPGQTLDTLVTIPTGPDAKFAVYEPAMHLDNNGQHAADPEQLAFGGMLTFVDTNAPAPSSDSVGPVSTHLQVSPNPSDGTRDVTITADLSDAATGNSAVTQAEFVVDDAVSTGVGFGVPMTGGFGSIGVSGATGSIPATVPNCTLPTGAPAVALSCLSAGKHTVFVRALDSAGNWGVVGSVILNLPKTGPQTTGGTVTPSPTNGSIDLAISATGDDSAAAGSITDAEYFLDTAGPNGSGKSLAPNRSATVVSVDGTLAAADVTALTEGTHHLLVHSKDSLGLWGPPLDIPFVVDHTGPAVDAADVRPNPSNGVLTDKSNPGYLVVSAQITDKDAGGGLQSNLSSAEAFLDPKTATPVGGTGLQLIAVDGKIDAQSEAVYGLIPISQIKVLTEGTTNHHVYVRGRDAAGNWGALFGVNLVIDKTAPVLTAPLTGSPNPTNGAANLTLTANVTEAIGLGTAEFWLGATDPGVGKGTRVSVSMNNGVATASVPLAGIALGAQQFNLRVQDTAGNWSKSLSTVVTVSRPNVIFANNFELSDPAWSTATGGATLTSAAALRTVLEPASNRGLQVALPGGAANTAGYLTDLTPNAETSYHVRFVTNPRLLTPGAGNITLFDAQSAQNTSVVSLQYRVNGGVPQVRAVLGRNTGGAVQGAWVALPAATTSTQVQLDWLSGPATGANQGSVVLKLNGAVVSTVTGNTSALRVETALLGVVNGVTGTTKGTAYFDSFLSTRFTLP